MVNLLLSSNENVILPSISYKFNYCRDQECQYNFELLGWKYKTFSLQTSKSASTFYTDIKKNHCCGFYRSSSHRKKYHYISIKFSKMSNVTTAVRILFNLFIALIVTILFFPSFNNMVGLCYRFSFHKLTQNNKIFEIFRKE